MKPTVPEQMSAGNLATDPAVAYLFLVRHLGMQHFIKPQQSGCKPGLRFRITFT
jgi:hypothetical protein